MAQTVGISNPESGSMSSLLGLFGFSERDRELENTKMKSLCRHVKMKTVSLPFFHSHFNTKLDSGCGLCCPLEHYIIILWYWNRICQAN